MQARWLGGEVMTHKHEDLNLDSPELRLKLDIVTQGSVISAPTRRQEVDIGESGMLPAWNIKLQIRDTLINKVLAYFCTQGCPPAS